MTIADRLLELAVMGRMALYTDIDGTLSPIALTPGSARIEPGAAEALTAISTRGIRVVAISGRSADDARNLVGLDSIDYAGNHGFELLTPSGRIVSEEVQRASIAVLDAITRLEEIAPSLPSGILIENKTFTGSVHYRLTANHQTAREVLRPLLETLADRNGLVVTEGRMVYELRPRLHINKGVFVTNDVHLHGITTAAFLGDDLTDVDGFRALAALERDHDLLASTSIAVTSDESPALVLSESQLKVAGVAGMVQELIVFADALTNWSPA